MWIWLTVAMAAEPTWSELASDYGFAAVHAELESTLLAAKSDKKLIKALDTAGLSQLSMPARATRGAELSVATVGPLAACRWQGGVVCRLPASLKGKMSASDYTASCRTLLGGSMPLTLVPVGSGEELAWDVTGVETCWKLDGAEVLLAPVMSGDLDGVGQGDEYHPPELVGLDYHQAMGILDENAKGFAYCQRKHPESDVSGTVHLAFTIAEDGSVGSVAPEGTVSASDPVVQCIVGRLERIRFPKPMGGFDKGTYAVTLLK